MNPITPMIPPRAKITLAVLNTVHPGPMPRSNMYIGTIKKIRFKGLVVQNLVTSGFLGVLALYTQSDL